MGPIDVYSLLILREPLSAITHLCGAACFAAMAVDLFRRGRGDAVRMASLLSLAVASVVLLTTSGLYHSMWPGPWRNLLVRADVSAVFLLIAGSLTPVHAILFRGLERWVPLALIWTTAILGIALRVAYFDSLSGEAGIGIFLLFGWSGAVTSVVLSVRYGWAFVRNGVFSGCAYTLGAIVLASHRPTLIAGIIGPHELWHLAVLAGLALHWRFVFQFASGELPATRQRLQLVASISEASVEQRHEQRAIETTVIQVIPDFSMRARGEILIPTQATYEQRRAA